MNLNAFFFIPCSDFCELSLFLAYPVCTQFQLLTPPQQLDPSLEAKVNIQRQPVILEEEYEKLKEMNLDEWKNIRGPRPWEDSREYQEQQRRKLSNKD
uniref:Cytochrome c oxidase assembly protein COX16 homolog, mitochondrial n=1 Tax=Astatotilapia calliptera TaxID=8154 RepID=A0A3P8RF77_ASTCA